MFVNMFTQIFQLQEKYCHDMENSKASFNSAHTLIMNGAAHGGTYTLNLNADIYYRVIDSQELSSHAKYTFVTVVFLSVLLLQLLYKNDSHHYFY